MNKSESLSNLMTALLAARSAIKPAGKSGKNTFDRYDYATELDWHNAVMPALLDNKLAMSFSITSVSNMPDRSTKNGGIEHAVEVQGTVTLMHESGEWLEVGICGQGQDRADKGVYKAMTGAKKYGYACLFSLPTTDDPERDEPPEVQPKQLQKPSPNPTGKPASAPQKTPPSKPAEKPTNQPDGYEKVMSEGLKYIGMVNDCAGANAMLAMLTGTKHVGTSKADLWKALNDRAAVVGCIYNKPGKQFETKPDA